ncbi:MAG: hypothetical protein H9535_19895 [Ignavibacteria bacterium]|nr:hypothetical protein [Ignavibacteria bacterium]
MNLISYYDHHHFYAFFDRWKTYQWFCLNQEQKDCFDRHEQFTLLENQHPRIEKESISPIFDTEFEVPIFKSTSCILPTVEGENPEFIIGYYTTDDIFPEIFIPKQDIYFTPNFKSFFKIIEVAPQQETGILYWKFKRV